MSSAHKPRVLVAMSGGVDSSVAAMALLERGYSVAGVTMSLIEAGNRHSPAAARAAVDAQRVADSLAIPHRVVDSAARFEREVIANFICEYAAGRTPNPCARCNQRIKFGALLEEADAVGAQFLATGHYARIGPRGPRTVLRRAVDAAKDQSYILAGLTQAQLARALFPLGELTKAEVREFARAKQLPIADRPESQDICFVPDDDYRAFLDERLGPAQPGPICSITGEILGRHEGYRRYTIGQRKGLGIAAPRPYYVVRLDPDRNTVIVAHEEEAGAGSLFAAEVNWVSISARTDPFECLAQIRYNHVPVPATATPEADGIRVTFQDPIRAIAPGQWVVLYGEDEVLAAGVIEDFVPNTRHMV